ncbi:MAG: fluoride efflux transporter CrcB [Gemmatimonadales bacterium]|nr:fluoride efflux transporter CrcB [Gemmatimonadales bacterium]
MQSLLLIGIAGALGAVARYGIGIWTMRTLGSHFAFGTLAVNVLGCLLLGFLFEAERNTSLVSPSLRLLGAVGFLGAFTTFSTFGYETFRYLQSGASHLALLNVSANLVLGLGAIWLGWATSRWILIGS